MKLAVKAGINPRKIWKIGFFNAYAEQFQIVNAQIECVLNTISSEFSDIDLNVFQDIPRADLDELHLLIQLILRINGVICLHF